MDSDSAMQLGALTGASGGNGANSGKAVLYENGKEHDKRISVCHAV